MTEIILMLSSLESEFEEFEEDETDTLRGIPLKNLFNYYQSLIIFSMIQFILLKLINLFIADYHGQTSSVLTLTFYDHHYHPLIYSFDQTC